MEYKASSCPPLTLLSHTHTHFLKETTNVLMYMGFYNTKSELDVGASLCMLLVVN